MVQRYAEDLSREIPEVDRFFGVNDYKEIAEYILQKNIAKNDCLRLLSTPSHYAYLKISEGCDKFCSFCAIPYIRGRHVSEPMESIIAQAEALARKGVKELIVVAQDTTNYGVDLYGECRLTSLLEQLAKIEADNKKQYKVGDLEGNKYYFSQKRHFLLLKVCKNRCFLGYIIHVKT